ncbi:MAG: YdcF family protein [Acidobacteria bacterium]|nr:YdcF family protein [Acidobacteriota bacterium]
MTQFANIVKSLLIPGSIPFLVFGLVAGVALLFGPQALQRWARRWLLLLLLLYGFLSTPFGANMLAGPLVREFSPIQTREQAGGADTVVVLSVSSSVYSANGQAVAEMGKATALNALEAARVFRLLGHPAVVASGGMVDGGQPGPTPGEILRNALVTLGVPEQYIETESRSRTTREQGLFVAELLRARGVRRFVLVTEANHMPRAVATFRQLGLDPLPSPSPFFLESPKGILQQLRPNFSALQLSDWASYEHLARAYYWLRGWSSSGPDG